MRRSLTIGVLPSALAAAALGVGAAQAGSTSPVKLYAIELAAEDPMPGGTFVILENRSAKTVGVGCWRIRTREAELVIRRPAVVPAGGGLRLLFDRGTAGNPDRVRLVRPAGRVEDATPVLHDTKGDDQLFSRTADGWVLGRGAQLPGRIVDGTLLRSARSGC